jgi:RHS repeat-associated protein
MLVDKAGTAAAVLDDNDFYPWGGVIPGVGKTTSNNTVKFTGQYRDTENGLDYFGARYYANVMGRFMSPDWASKPVTVPYAEFGDPQSLNLYSYVRNSPIVRVDAEGHDFVNEAFQDWGFDLGDPRWGLAPQPEGQQSQQQQEQQQSQQQQPQQQQQDKPCGFLCKVGNFVTGNGWKTDAQVTATHRQYLTDHDAKSVDAGGKVAAVDWSKASDKQVEEAYKYIRAVERAADRNYALRALVPATVIFGHGARHLQGTNLSQSEVESAILTDVQDSVRNATQPSTNFWGRVTVNGQTVEYRAYTLPDGSINVGTYYIP